MKINPIIIFNFFLFLFFAGGLWLDYFLFKIKIGYLPIIIMSGILIIILYIMYAVNFGISISEKTAKKIDDSKERLNYTEEKITIDIPILEEKTVVFWKHIEAIFLLNKLPLDGEYHNFEYLIISNSEPIVIKYDVQSWYNKISILPKPKKKGLPIIKINDYSNIDFYTFNEAINKYLVKANPETSSYLKLKFGNKIQNIKSENTTTKIIDQQLKTFGFYKIFDRENNLNDYNLNTFRKETDNKN
nr:hypothetical protein [uncultured Flavobacterium sp.]